ncbi:nitroreductase/quinone reductase family protein [Phytoactinopolyspora endophytica]|uniref:nitroreductase/quinone reductase family protein n=1 Tax=Phytoactinopolyspora endophytica TaxID=1642495 RepID=UPI00101D88DA|nr:nitroreductase/quinone reductase family protein [Phytoactinopolyspora endophytica]
MHAQVTDSPDTAVADHVRRYIATDGADGYLEGGSTNLVLTTVGRSTGKRRRTGLFFGRDGDRYVLVASGARFGDSTLPHWYRNLLAHPEVEVQVRAERFTARARTVDGPERTRLWRQMVTQAPVFERHQEAVAHEIPVVILEIV